LRGVVDGEVAFGSTLRFQKRCEVAAGVPRALDAHSGLGLCPDHKCLAGLENFVFAVQELQPSVTGVHVVVSERDIILEAA